MPYNEELDARISKLISRWNSERSEQSERKKMFGGTCHLLGGNMVCGVYKDFLILRLGEERARQALTDSRIKPFDITGRPMKGWVMVPQAGLSDEALRSWLSAAREFVETMPPK
jgi:hypothetical protein